MDLLGWAHLGAALAGLASGGAVLLMAKGTEAHRWMGRLYIASMVTINGTALMIYDLFGYFGPFHWAAMLSLLTIIMGMVPALRRRPKGGWVPLHAYWMAGSYVGLVAAAVSESSTRFLDYPFGASVITATAAVTVIGVLLTRWRVPLSIRALGRAERRPGAP